MVMNKKRSFYNPAPSRFLRTSVRLYFYSFFISDNPKGQKSSQCGKFSVTFHFSSCFLNISLRFFFFFSFLYHGYFFCLKSGSSQSEFLLCSQLVYMTDTCFLIPPLISDNRFVRYRPIRLINSDNIKIP